MNVSDRIGTDRRRFVIVVVVVASVLVTSWYAGAQPSRLGDSDGLSSFLDVLSSLFHPDLSLGFVARIGKLAVESLLIGALGMFFALCIGMVLAIAAVRLPTLPESPDQRRWPQIAVGVMRNIARGVLAMFRSVPEIVWAFLFVRIFGLGPGPAVLAIGITFGGIIGKLFAELLEAADPDPARALRTAGASWFAVFMYGMLPQVRSQWVSYALFRLECAIRSASILGVVEPASDLRPGVVSMAHGFGDAPGRDGEVRSIGSSTNRLVADDRGYDPYSGIPIMSGIPVAVQREAGS